MTTSTGSPIVPRRRSTPRRAFRALRVVLLLALPAAIAACASVPRASAAADAEGKTSFSPPPGRGRIYVARTGRLFGAALPLQVTVDGRVLGTTGPGTYLVCDVEAGAHHVTSQAPGGADDLALDVQEGHTYFVEQSPRFNPFGAAHVELRQLDDKEGREAVRSTSRVQAAF